jgi:hypothetical protein
VIDDGLLRAITPNRLLASFILAAPFYVATALDEVFLDVLACLLPSLKPVGHTTAA